AILSPPASSKLAPPASISMARTELADLRSARLQAAARPRASRQIASAPPGKDGNTRRTQSAAQACRATSAAAKAGEGDNRRRRLREPLKRARTPACRSDRKSTRLNSSHLGISYAV